MKELVIRVSNVQGQTDAEILEKVYRLVRVGEYVKFKGKAYVRVSPRRNKYFKQPLHFVLLSDDIYAGSYGIVDDDGETVSVACHYRVTLIPELEYPKKE